MNPLEQEPAFREPWEAQAFAIVVKLNELGYFTWSEWAEMLGKHIAEAPQHSYYENWLSALETIVERKAIVTRAERLHRIEDWNRAARATPHGKPIELIRCERATGVAQSTNRTPLASSL